MLVDNNICYDYPCFGETTKPAPIRIYGRFVGGVGQLPNSGIVGVVGDGVPDPYGVGWTCYPRQGAYPALSDVCHSVHFAEHIKL